MAVTAKIKLNTVQEIGPDHWQLSFTAPYADEKGNKINQEWAKYTPHLNINMSVNDDAVKHFEAGKSYTLTFTEDSDG